ncbi:MAG: hypothetical protein JJD97_12105 [Gemmatimonadaceae bacterium]|nr:hypothetical protein [Gemmatimonadaceae bacterium]
MFGMMLLMLFCGAPCTTGAADSAMLWRYDLRAGDHLVYREIFRQEIDGSAVYKLTTGRDKPFGTLGALVRAELRASIDDRNTIRLDAQHVRRLRLLLRPDLFAHPGDVKVVLNGRTVFQGALPSDCALYRAHARGRW